MRRIMVTEPEIRPIDPIVVKVDDVLGTRVKKAPPQLAKYFEGVIKGTPTLPSTYAYCDSWDDVDYFLKAMDDLKNEYPKISPALVEAEEDNRRKAGIQTGSRPNFHVQEKPFVGNGGVLDRDVVDYFRKRAEANLKKWEVKAAPVKRHTNLSCPTWVPGAHPLNDANAIMNAVMASKLQKQPGFKDLVNNFLQSIDPNLTNCFTLFARKKLSHKFKPDYDITSTGPVASTESKGVVDELRTIQSAPGIDNMAMKTFQNYGNFDMKSDFVTKSIQNADLFNICRAYSQAGYELRSSDYASYDLTVSEEMKEDYVYVNKPVLDHLGLTHVMEGFIRMPLLTPKYVAGDQAFLLNAKATIRSGQATTTHEGTLIARMINVHALKKITGYSVDDCFHGARGKVFTKIKGDDKANAFYGVDPEEYYHAVRDLGMNIDGLPGFNYLMTHFDPQAFGPHGFVSRALIQTFGRESAPPDTICELWGIYIRSCRVRVHPLFSWYWSTVVECPSWLKLAPGRMIFDRLESYVLSSNFQSKLKVSTRSIAGQKWLRDILESGSQGSLLMSDVTSSMAIKAMFGLIDQNFSNLDVTSLFDASDLFTDSEILEWLRICSTEVVDGSYAEPGSKAVTFVKKMATKGLVIADFSDGKLRTAMPVNKLIEK